MCIRDRCTIMSGFPNIWITWRVLLTIPVTVARRRLEAVVLHSETKKSTRFILADDNIFLTEQTLKEVYTFYAHTDGISI